MLAKSHKAMVVAATGAGKTSVTVKYLEDHNLQGLVFLVDNMGIRHFLIGVTFGTGPMSKDLLDVEIDSWVEQVVVEDAFQGEVAAYLKKEKMWEEFMTNGILPL